MQRCRPSHVVDLRNSESVSALPSVAGKRLNCTPWEVSSLETESILALSRSRLMTNVGSGGRWAPWTATAERKSIAPTIGGGRDDGGRFFLRDLRFLKSAQLI